MNPVLYLIMRNDIPSMNPGKLAAQACHVGHAFKHEFVKNKQAVKNLGKLFTAWEKQTPQGFGTTITLGATGSIICGYGNGYMEGSFEGTVYDPTYPCEIPLEVALDLIGKVPSDMIVLGNKSFYLRDEIVGAYVFLDKDNLAVQGVIGNLELYP